MSGTNSFYQFLEHVLMLTYSCNNFFEVFLCLYFITAIYACMVIQHELCILYYTSIYIVYYNIELHQIPNIWGKNYSVFEVIFTPK